MKKLYLFFMLLFSLLGVTQVFAQEEGDEVTIDVQLDNGKWVEWNGAEATPWARSWYSTTTPAISICTKVGGNKTTDIRGNQFNGANNMSTWGTEKNDLMFFSRFGNNDAIYEIMVAKGWWIKSIEFDFNCANDKGAQDGSITVSMDGGDQFTSAALDDDQHVAWENSDESVFAEKFTVTRNEGSYNFARTSNFKVVVVYLGPQVDAAEDVQAIWESYQKYLEGLTLGTQPGQYDEEAFNAFKDLMEAWAETFNFESYLDMTVEEIQAEGEKIEQAFEALMATRVPMTLATGYYRIRSAHEFTLTEMDEETQTEVTTHPVKYLSAKMGSTIAARWSTPDDLDTFSPALWKVEQKDTVFDIVSAAYDVRFTAAKPVTLSAESDSLIALDPVKTEDGVSYVNIRLAAAQADAYNYFHCASWSSAQEGGITLWSNNDPATASEWIFEPVSDAVAQDIIAAYAPMKEHELMIVDYNAMLTESNSKLPQEVEIKKDNNLITANEQFSSPWTESSEGSLNNLLDGNKSTYWHSAWSGGNVANHTHYLQVALAEPVDEMVAMTIARRPVANDHVTKWGIYGSNDPEAADDAWTVLASRATPYGNNTETLTTMPFDTKGFKHLRFYIDGTTTGRGYGHVSEFQLNPATYSSKAAENLAKVIDEQSFLKEEEITETEYNALKAAFEAFMATFVDVTELRDALTNTEGTADLIVKGTNPGQWSDDSQAAAFKALWDEANAYFEAGEFEVEKVQDYAERLNKMKEDILSSANGVKTGKWYTIRFATEEEYEDRAWDKVAGAAQTIKAIEGEIVQSQALWNKVAAAAVIKVDSVTYTYQVNPDSIAERKSATYTVTEADATELGVGNNVHFIDKGELINEDMAKFRFIAVGDTAYALQNKATGLFIKANTTGAVILSAHPTLFTTSALGYGFNLIAAKTLDGASQNYLHAQVAQNTLVTWNATALASRSAFYIEEAGDAADFVAEVNIPAGYGALNNYCFPVALTPKGGQAWTVNGVEGTEIKLAKITDNKVAAGRPFIYINASTDDYIEGEDAEFAVFTMPIDEIAKTADDSHALKGTYSTIVIDRGEIYMKGNQFLVNPIAKDAIMVELTRVAANRAYISPETPLDPKAELSVVWDQEAPDGIETALTNVSKAGAVYDLNGRLVSRKATLNEISNFGKGIYILNGTKVIVK